MNTLAHRSGLAEAVFDDTLRGCSDWELVLRLTALRAPLALPVVACTYSTDAPHRISADPMAFVDGRAVARRARSTRAPPGPGLQRPSCVGVWANPHLAERVPGTLALPAYFGRAGQLPPPAQARDLVLSVSAGLPKKDWPVSVAEGLCAGASVVVPDVPDMDRVAGPGARRYRHADDIVAHAAEVLAEGPAVEEERRINREYGLATYAAPETPARFFSELQERVDAWWASRN